MDDIAEEPSTSEERFLDSALQSLKLHAKAKLLVNDMVTKVKEAEERDRRGRTGKSKAQGPGDTFAEWANF